MSTPRTDDGIHVSQEFREDQRDREHPPTAVKEREQTEQRRDLANARAAQVEQHPAAAPQNMMVTDIAQPERAPNNRRRGGRGRHAANHI